MQLDLQPSGTVVSTIFALSPDSSRVVYGIGPEGNPIELYSVPITGPADASIRLNQFENAGLPFLIDATSTRVVYAGRTGDRDDVYSVPIDAVGRRSRPTAEIDGCNLGRCS